MENLEVISWPRDFPEFKRMDNLLRCGICYEYMKNCMITSCSHNYCSLCIRKYMQYKALCPTCLEETYETNLRNNRPLDELILIYTAIRDKLFRHLRLSTVHVQPSLSDSEEKTNNLKLTRSLNENYTPASKKTDLFSSSKKEKQILSNEKKLCKGKSVSRRLSDTVERDDGEMGVFVLKSPATPKPHTSIVSTNQVTPVTKIPAIFCSPKKTIAANVCPVVLKQVPCPVCDVNIPERNINSHLDSCLARVNSPKKRTTSDMKKRSPIPKRVYNMMIEKDLRKWLKSYGLNSAGDKKALITRLQRYTVLYNSECDSENPRSVSDIIRQIEIEEKQEKLATTSIGFKKQINRHTEPKVIEEENRKYLEKNKASFQSLINAMRDRDQTNIRPTKHVVNRVESDDSDVADDSYFLKETVGLMDDMPSCSNHFINGTALSDQIISDVKSDSDKDIFVVDTGIQPKPYCQSPDLSKDGRLVDENVINFKTENHINGAHSSYVEKTLPVVSDILSSPEIKCKKINNSFHQEQDDCSDSESDNSISLLADFEAVNQENDFDSSHLVESCLQIEMDDSRPTESQITDPDYKVTDSEMIIAGSDNSEDEFVPVQRKKRQRTTTFNSNLPKRVLRKRTK